MIKPTPILTRIRLPLAALALAQPAMMPAMSAAQSVQDFQLPPNPTPTPTAAAPQVQGPVDSDAPLATTPRQVPTATPTPPARQPSVTQIQPAPRAATRPAPAITRPEQRFTPARQQARNLPAAGPATRLPGLEPDTAKPTDTPSPVTEASLPGFSTDFPSAQPAQIGVGDSDNPAWPWSWILAFAVLVAGLLGAVFWRRQRAVNTVPATIAPPLVKDSASEPAATAKTANGSDAGSILSAAASAAPEPSPAQWVKVEARATQLQRTMLNANLIYRLVITNRSGKALTNVAVEADLATAHGQLPVEEQLASPQTELTVRETIERLAPGERFELSGNILLPLSSVKVIQQGPKALLCVPLLRVRIVCEDRDAIARTWVIGRQTAATRDRVQPFRFDEPPQTYNDIGQRALD